jgi:hypothetical protein
MRHRLGSCSSPWYVSPLIRPSILEMIFHGSACDRWVPGSLYAGRHSDTIRREVELCRISQFARLPKFIHSEKQIEYLALLAYTSNYCGPVALRVGCYPALPGQLQ